MSDAQRPRRPILKLKIDPPVRPATEALPPKSSSQQVWTRPADFVPRRTPRPPPMAAPAPPPKPVVEHPWKCKPCGTGFTPSPDLGDEDAVRCPSCNARLGRAADFRSDPPNLEKLRARLAKKG